MLTFKMLSAKASVGSMLDMLMERLSRTPTLATSEYVTALELETAYQQV